MTAEIYRDILADTMLPFARDRLAKDFIFQQDRDPKHTAGIIMGNAKKGIVGWFEQNQVEVLDWPPQSPDLNPIEHVWDHIYRKLVGRRFKNLAELYHGVETEWKAVDLNYLVKLVDSMPKRCAAVLKARGFPTKY